MIYNMCGAFSPADRRLVGVQSLSVEPTLVHQQVQKQNVSTGEKKKEKEKLRT